MASPKVWTADDVQQRRLYLERQGSDILVQRDYVFVDGQDQQLFERLEVFQTTIAVASIPANVISALQDIDAWIYDQILAQEGMED